MKSSPRQALYPFKMLFRSLPAIMNSNFRYFLAWLQQSAAFKILRTRLKAVPSYTFSSEQLKRTSSGNPYQIIHHISGGSNISQDGDIHEDEKNLHNGIKFTLRLQQFEQMQHLHRMHAKAQAQAQSTSSSPASPKVGEA